MGRPTFLRLRFYVSYLRLTFFPSKDFGAISRDFGRKIVRPRKILKNFGPDRDEIRRATACRRSVPCLGTSVARGKAAHHQSAGMSTRSRAISDEKFCGRENFRKFRPEIESKSHAISRSIACRPSEQLLGTCQGRKRAAHHKAASISALSNAISD